MLTVETQKPIMVMNRMDSIEEALACPQTSSVRPTGAIPDLQNIMTSVARLGPEHAETILGITHNVLIDVRIASKRVLNNTPAPVTTLRREPDVDPIAYAVTYIEKLSQQLTSMSMDGTANMAAIIAGEIQARISEYAELVNKQGI